VLRGSQVPHAADLGKLRMRFGEGVTGWVAEHKSPVALPHHAPDDARFKHIDRLIEDTYQALLSVPVISGTRPHHDDHGGFRSGPSGILCCHSGRRCLKFSLR